MQTEFNPKSEIIELVALFLSFFWVLKKSQVTSIKSNRHFVKRFLDVLFCFFSGNFRYFITQPLVYLIEFSANKTFLKQDVDSYI